MLTILEQNSDYLNPWYFSTVKDWGRSLDSVAVSLSFGIQRQVVHGTFEIIAIDL